MPALRIEKRAHPFGEKGVNSSLEEVAKKIKEGALHPKVRAWAVECLERARKEQGLGANTDKQRAEILLRAVQKKLWVPDPTGSEWMAGAHLMACDRSTADELCILSGDCFAEGTILLAEGHEPVPVEDLKPGMKIWGLDRWSSVEAVAYKGVLSIDVVTLNNGSELKLTSGHHVSVLDCEKHPMLSNGENPISLPTDRHWRGGGSEECRRGCSCLKEERVEKRTRISELREGMVMTTPDRIPFGTESMDPDRAYIEGLYASDGCQAKNAHFEIAGKDGFPKESQKREVQEACERLDIPTTWRSDRIRVRDKEWTLRMQQMGRYAPEKHLLSINLDERAAGPTLRGVMADSGQNTRGPGRTFTTTSFELAFQTRLLHKMFGVSCGRRYIENHGGLGKNPIFRLGTREREPDGRHEWLLRVKDIAREVTHVPCWDIQTDDHRVYLAEHDVTVFNCDDLVVLVGSCFMSVGLYVLVVGHSYNKDKKISHVLSAVRFDGEWHYADPSADIPMGRCMKATWERVYSVPNITVLCDDTSCIKPDPKKWDPADGGFVTQGVFVGVNGLGRSAITWLADPLTWLGQQDDVEGEAYDAAYKAASKKIVDRDGGFSSEDLKVYFETAGAAAGTAACAVMGAGPASPACGVIAGLIAGWIAETVVPALIGMGEGLATVPGEFVNLFKGTPGTHPLTTMAKMLSIYRGMILPDEPRWSTVKAADEIRKAVKEGPAFYGFQCVKRGFVEGCGAYDKGPKLVGAEYTLKQRLEFEASEKARKSILDDFVAKFVATSVAKAAKQATEGKIAQSPPFSVTTEKKKSKAIVVMGTLAIGGALAWWLL